VSIGEALAEARHQAGLTVTQVSRRTRIRETIIRKIENDDYSACGGDFYARGHIRSLAKVAGADPEPLIREYDTTHQAPQTMTLADVFPGTPTTPGMPTTAVKTREKRQPNRTTALALVLALLVALGFVAYDFLSGPRQARSTAPEARAQPTTNDDHLGPNRQATAVAPARPTLQPQTPTPVSAVALAPHDGQGDNPPARAALDRPQTHPSLAHRLARHRPLREPVPGQRPAPRHRLHGSDHRRSDHPRQRRPGQQRCHGCAGPGRHHG
jgi:cytoskeletal protein RodZ